MSARRTIEAAGDERIRRRDTSDAVRCDRVGSRVEDAASDDDRRWFRANPDRTLRLRFALPGELGLGLPPASITVLVKQLAPGVRARGLILRYWLARFPPPDSLPDDDTLRFVLWTAQESPAYLPWGDEDWGCAFAGNAQLLATVQARFDQSLAAVGGTA